MRNSAMSSPTQLAVRTQIVLRLNYNLYSYDLIVVIIVNNYVFFKGASLGKINTVS